MVLYAGEDAFVPSHHRSLITYHCCSSLREDAFLVPRSDFRIVLGSTLRLPRSPSSPVAPASLTAKSMFRNIHLLHWVVSSVGRATDS